MTETLQGERLQHLAPLVRSRQLASSIWTHAYYAPEVAAQARPGQFVHIRVNAGTAPLLRRPLSILDVDRDEGTFRVLFKVVGVGTNILGGMREGETLDLLGPLGSAFKGFENYRRLTMVAGGIGMVPLHFLARRLQEDKSENRPKIDYWFGARSTDEIYLLDDLRRWCSRVEPVTEDGTIGRTGRVTQFAEDEMRGADAILACGPNPMLADLQRRTRDWEQPVFAAMESFMGCGLGACLGCVITTTEGYERVCTEGPVFDLRRLVFEG